MRAIDVVGSAIGNSFRSRLRTTLTVLAIFIGAFTLTITNGLGTGINAYITDTVAAIGANDVLTVTKVSADATTTGPQEYSPDQITSGGGAAGGAAGRTTVAAITPTDPENTKDSRIVEASTLNNGKYVDIASPKPRQIGKVSPMPMHPPRVAIRSDSPKINPQM